MPTVTAGKLLDLGASFDCDSLKRFHERYPKGVPWETQEELQQLVEDLDKQHISVSCAAKLLGLTVTVKRFNCEGNVFAEYHYKDGKLHDPAPGKPALLELDPRGQVNQVRHYKNGRLHDPDKDTPAWRWYVGGQLLLEGRFNDGERGGTRVYT